MAVFVRHRAWFQWWRGLGVLQQVLSRVCQGSANRSDGSRPLVGCLDISCVPHFDAHAWKIRESERSNFAAFDISNWPAWQLRLRGDQPVRCEPSTARDRFAHWKPCARTLLLSRKIVLRCRI